MWPTRWIPWSSPVEPSSNRNSRALWSMYSPGMSKVGTTATSSKPFMPGSETSPPSTAPCPAVAARTRVAYQTSSGTLT